MMHLRDHWEPGRLWSLLDMLKRSATSFVNLGARVKEVQMLYISDPLNSEELRQHRNLSEEKALKMLKEACDSMGLSVSASLVDHCSKYDTRDERDYDYVMNTVVSELNQKLFLYVPQHRARYFDRDDFLSPAARTAFPKAMQELRTGGNCHTSGLYTAAVFHCMRALEHGIAALAGDVGLVYSTQNWQNILDEIGSAYAALSKSLPKGTAKNERLQFLSEAVTELRYFKDGWRNHVSHNKVEYDESQSEQVLEHVTSFIETLSRHVVEAP